MIKLTKTLFAFCISVLLLLSFTSPIHAVQFKTGTSLILARDQKIDETIFAAGEKITIDADIAGDLHCAGQSVVITSNIKGDVLCVAQTIKITGAVDGNVRVMAQVVDLQGSISRNLNVLAQNLILSDTSFVKGDILFGVQTIDLLGDGGQDLAGAGETINISGSLLRNALVNVSSLQVSDQAKIKGDLDYTTSVEGVATISSKAVSGQVTRHEMAPQENPTKAKEIKEASSFAIVTVALFGVLSFFILACALIYFDKHRTEKIVNTIQTKPITSILIGLAVMVVYPISFFILLVTIVGLPLATVSLMTYIISLITGSVYTSIVIGWNAVKLINKSKTPNSFLSAIVGCTVLGVTVNIPFIGWFIGLLTMLSGLGAIFSTLLPEKTK